MVPLLKQRQSVYQILSSCSEIQQREKTIYNHVNKGESLKKNVLMYFHLKNKYLENNLKINKYKKRKNIANYDGWKYSNDINWWVFTKRYKNGHMVDVLPVDILDDILKISNDLMEGYYLKEEFLDIVHHYNQIDVEKQITKWISKCIEKNIPEFVESVGTISRWKEYILNSFIDDRYSNGYTEGINNKIKVIKRIAFGYKSFELFRERILYIFNGKISESVKRKMTSKSKNS